MREPREYIRIGIISFLYPILLWVAAGGNIISISAADLNQQSAVVFRAGLLYFMYKFFRYKGEINETRATNAAAIAAMSILLFQTDREHTTWIGVLHLVAAMVFFGSIAFLLLKCWESNRINFMTGWTIIGCVVLCALFIPLRALTGWFTTAPFIFWTEAVAIIAMGIAFLQKGGFKLKLK